MKKLKIKKSPRESVLDGSNFIILAWAIFIDIIGFFLGLLAFIPVINIFAWLGASFIALTLGLPAVLFWAYTKYKKNNGKRKLRFLKNTWKVLLGELFIGAGPWLTMFVLKTIRGRRWVV